MQQSSGPPESALISNNFVQCYSDRLVIDLYYFPYGSKTIRYSDIRSCELLRMRDLSMLHSKLWGMALSPIWWHSDLRRYSREYYILLDANQWPKIGLTMDDNDIIHVYKLIKDRMSPQQDDKVDVRMKSALSEKEVEYQQSLQANREEATK